MKARMGVPAYMSEILSERPCSAWACWHVLSRAQLALRDNTSVHTFREVRQGRASVLCSP